MLIRWRTNTHPEAWAIYTGELRIGSIAKPSADPNHGTSSSG
ncbi:hypothetical protein [Bradyrhizobium japonicum]|nr:hypothetical protein [Bradyrhizobium japonicum]